MADGMIVPPANSPEPLLDIGTRFKFLGDFQDWLGDGLIAVTNSLSRYNNDSDNIRKKNLTAALVLLEVYQKNLGHSDRDKWDFNNLLDKCAPARGVLETIRAEKAQAKVIPSVEPVQGPDGNPDGLETA